MKKLFPAIWSNILKSFKHYFKQPLIRHKYKLLFLFSFLFFITPIIQAQEFGTDDFRISDAGGIGNVALDAVDSDVAYNSLNNQYLVVWEADDTDFAGVVDNEFEIIGQIIDANGNEIGVDFIISTFQGLGNGNFDAIDPAVAYNSTTNEYLVVWSGDRIPGEEEIYGQIISSTGSKVGANFRISDVGSDNDTSRDAFTPEVTYNKISNEYFVIWRGDDAIDNEDEIYGQRISATGIELGTNDFLISTGFTDPNFDAREPQLIWNSVNNEYFVVWQHDYITLNLLEIIGQRISGTTGALINTNFRISNQTENIAFDAFSPTIAYNKTDNEYLVVWDGDRSSGEDEIYGQRISSLGTELGSDFKISSQGTDGDANIDAINPDVTWKATTNTYMVVWQGDDDTAGDDEIWMQEITGAGALSGAVIQVSDLGPSASYDSLDPKIAANTEQGMLITWEGDTAIGEEEIYIQMYGSPTLTINRFTAATNNNWSIATNWILGTIPTGSSDVLIHPGKTANVDITNAAAKNLNVDCGTLNINTGQALTINGNLTQNGTFSINSDAITNGSLIVKGTATGNVTYKRYLTTSGVAAQGWHLIGTPVNGQSINSFSGSFLTSGVKKAITPYVNNVASASRWNYFTTDGTNPIASAGNFVKAKGYSTKIGTAGTLDFTGTLNVNDAGETIAITDGGDNPTGNRWNLISSPYTASLKGGSSTDDTNSFLRVNINASALDPARAGLYLWNGTTYSEKAIDDDFFIAPGQAFFVHAKDKVGMVPESSASFTEAMQTHQTGNLFLKNGSSYPEMILQITDLSNSSSTKIRYIQNRTTGLDVGSDVGTFTGASNSFKVFTHLVSNSEGIDFAIQALPNTGYENMVVPVGVNAEAGKEITFSLNASNFSSSMKIYLEDKTTNIFTQLNQSNNTYKVNLKEALNGIGRFYIHTTTSSLSVDKNISFKNLSIYKLTNNTLRIAGLAQENTSIKLFTILGKQVMSTSFKSTSLEDIALPNLAAGIYIIQLQTDKRKLNKKIILE